MIRFALILTIAFVPTFGYVDPGTGSYLIQLLIGSFLGLIFLMRQFWSRITEFFRNLFRGKER